MYSFCNAKTIISILQVSVRFQSAENKIKLYKKGANYYEGIN